MSESEVKSWSSRIAGLAGSMLLAAVLLSLAVDVLRSIWVWLVIIFGAIALVAGFIVWLKRRLNGW